MINCYKILEVPNFSDLVTIRKSYIRLAKQYHPDVAVQVDDEKIKLINKAYDTLSDTALKKYHDEKLKYYLQPRTTTTTTSQSRSRKSPFYGVKSVQEMRERKERVARIKLRMDMIYYQKQNNQLPYSYRLAGWIVFALFGWQQVYQHWFVSENSYDHALGFMGGLIYISAAFGAYSTAYKMFRFKHFNGQYKSNFWSLSTKIWLGIMLFGIITLPSVNSYRKSYLLEHNSKIAIVDYRNWGSDQIQIRFTPMGSDELIVKHLKLTEESVYDQTNQWVMIRFVKSNPKIMTIVKREENIHLPEPLK